MDNPTVQPNLLVNKHVKFLIPEFKGKTGIIVKQAGMLCMIKHDNSFGFGELITGPYTTEDFKIDASC